MSSNPTVPTLSRERVVDALGRATLAAQDGNKFEALSSLQEAEIILRGLDDAPGPE